MAVALREGPVFVKKKHELSDIAKRLDKLTIDSIDLMEESLADAENKLTLKERLKLAETILDLKVRITDQINKDELNRQIAEIRAKGLSTPLLPNDEKPKPGAPRLDMNTIQSV